MNRIAEVLTLNRLLIGLSIVLCVGLIGMTYLAYVVLPLLEAVYLVFIQYVYGYAILRYMPAVCGVKQNRDALEDLGKVGFMTTAAVGLIFTTFFFYAVSLGKVLSAGVVTGYYAVPAIIFFFIQKRKAAHGDFISTLAGFSRRPAGEYLLLALAFLYAALPPSFYDSLAYHLGIPNLYLQNGGFIATPQLFYANTFIYYEISLIPAVFAGDLVPTLFHFLMGVVLILSFSDAAADYLKIKRRFLLVLILVSLPMSTFLLSVVKNDLISPFFILPGIIAFIKNRRCLSALLLGFSLGVKYTNIIPLGVFLLLFFIKEKKFPIKQIIVFGIIIAVVLLPLMVKNYVYTGNPFFPFFHSYFPNKIQYWDASRFTLLEEDAKKLFYSFKDAIRFPISLSFEQLGSGGIVGPLFLVFLPFLIFKREKRLFPFYFAILTLLIGANFKLSTRVWYISFLILSGYAAVAVEFVSQRFLGFLFYGIIGFNLVTSFGLQEYLFRSSILYSGKASVEEYKSLAFSTYSAIEYVNKQIPPDSKVLLLGEAKNYYLKRPYVVSSGYDYSIIKKHLDNIPTANAFIDSLRADGIRYIILNIPEFHRLQKQYRILTDAEAAKTLGFLGTLVPVFRDDKEKTAVLKVGPG